MTETQTAFLLTILSCQEVVETTRLQEAALWEAVELGVPAVVELGLRICSPRETALAPYSSALRCGEVNMGVEVEGLLTSSAWPLVSTLLST